MKPTLSKGGSSYFDSEVLITGIIELDSMKGTYICRLLLFRIRNEYLLTCTNGHTEQYNLLGHSSQKEQRKL
jgi:hypothetical protein